MNPIVNGIAKQYLGKVDVRRLNALQEGRAAFDYFRLPGHPAYVLLLPTGQRIWSDIGIKSPAEIATQLDAVLEQK
jgi:hypothetical protein